DSEQAISEFDVAYFMVSLDYRATNDQFASLMKVNYPILSDTSKKTAKAYGVLGLAGLFTKRWTFYIDVDGTIRAIDQNVSVLRAGTEIVETLEALGFPKRT
ncbi:MAG: redoxin domain-containing protein, partial [Deltaproteobacteria bacterium]|nr:redoxin domain-containing protein [Deltaproteobacteria bacterium]